jgi:hypothetical protein
MIHDPRIAEIAAVAEACGATMKGPSGGAPGSHGTRVSSGTFAHDALKKYGVSIRQANAVIGRSRNPGALVSQLHNAGTGRSTTKPAFLRRARG